MSKPATIQIITDIQPIEGADRIEVASVLGWKVVVKKGVHSIGEVIIYVEIDSVLPKLPQYEFIKNTKKNEKGEEKYYVRTIRLRKQISQGLILPITALCANNAVVVTNSDNKLKIINIKTEDGTNEAFLEVGLDVSNFLDIQHYEKQIHGSLSGVAKGNFPSFISKTDEERLQNIPKILEKLKGQSYYISTKLDGTSFTAYYKEGKLGVCSRNLELIENPDNPYWKIAAKYNLLNVLGNHEGGYLAIQGELCGPGIQGNPLGLKEVDLFIFNIYNIAKDQYFNYDELCNFCFDNKLKMVPVIEKSEPPFKIFDYSLEQLLEMAKGKYEGTDTDREGIVVRSLDMEISFKVINNDYEEREEK